MPAVETGAHFKPNYNRTLVTAVSLILMFQQDLEIHCSSELQETSWNTLAQIPCVCLQILKPFRADACLVAGPWVFPKSSVFRTVLYCYTVGQDALFFLTCSTIKKKFSIFSLLFVIYSLWRECDCVGMIWLILLGNNIISSFSINNNLLDNPFECKTTLNKAFDCGG